MGISRSSLLTRKGVWGLGLILGASAFAIFWAAGGAERAPRADRCETPGHACGFIGAEFVDTLEAALAEHTQITLYSHGGHADHALDAARAILPAQANAVIDRACISACVEVVLPAFGHVTLRDAPLLAAHGNVRMRNQLAEAQGVDISPCSGPYLQALSDVMGGRLNPENPQVQIDRLGITEAEIDWPEGRRCPSMYVTSSADYWALTADDLARHFAITAVGATAADTPAVIQDRINCHIPAGSRVRVHNAILISQGHSGRPDCNPGARVDDDAP